MRPIRCLILDDEELARALLTNYVERMPQLELVDACADPMSALTVLQDKAIDLLLLDIQMPGLTGIEFLNTLRQKPAVVFTTAYSDYALESYNLDAVDYLLKPFGFERFVQAINKASTFLRAQAPEQNAPEKDHLLIKSEHRVHRIRYDDILYIQSMREYAAFYTPTGRLLSLNSLKGLETELPADRFIRIHKSYIVAIDKVDTLEGNMLHIGKEKLPIGANYKEVVLKRVF